MGGTISAPTIEIAAPEDAVFAILANVREYRGWMPFTVAMDQHGDGPLTKGTPITEHVVLDPARPASIRLQRVVVTEVASRPGQHFLHWESVMGAKAILHARRVQRVTAAGDGFCVYETSDTMSGILAPLALALYGGAVARGFAAQGRALKERAEGQAKRT